MNKDTNSKPNYKFNNGINVKGIVENGFNLLPDEAIIFDLIASILVNAKSNKKAIKHPDKKGYYLFAKSFISTQCPMLRTRNKKGELVPYSKLTIQRKINQLIGQKLVIRASGCDASKQGTYLAKGKNFDKILTNYRTPVIENTPIKIDILPISKLTYPPINFDTPLYQNRYTPLSKLIYNNSIIYNRIIDNKINTILFLSEIKISNGVISGSSEIPTDHTENILNPENVSTAISIQSEIEQQFEMFWNAYDKKTGRPKSLAKWKLLKTAEREKAIDFIPAYKAHQSDKKYRKNPESYLNQKFWESEEILNDYKPNNGHGEYIELFRTEYLKWNKAKLETSESQTIENTNSLNTIISELVSKAIQHAGGNPNTKIEFNSETEKYYETALLLFQTIMQKWEMSGYEKQASIMGANTGLGLMKANIHKIMVFMTEKNKSNSYATQNIYVDCEDDSGY